MKSLRGSIITFTVFSHLASGILSAAPTPFGPLPGPASDDDIVEMLNVGLPEKASSLDEWAYSPEILADYLEYDPIAAFEYVRGSIRFDPYAGVLRGADGALAAKSGNAFDRSLLLKKLLDEMAIETRLAFGKIEEKSARELLDSSNSRRSAPDPAVLISPVALDRTVARAKRDYDWLLQGLEGKALGSRDTRIVPRDLIAHVWVQARFDNAWVDLDTSFPEAKPGQVFGDVESYALEPTEGDFHTVTIRLVGETVAGHSVSETALLEDTFVAHEMQEAPVLLLFGATNSSVGGSVGQKLTAQSLMSPILIVGRDILKGKSVPGISAQLTESEEFLFGGGAQSSALFLDVTVSAPGVEPVTKRRVLYDRFRGQDRVAGEFDEQRLQAIEMFGEAPAAFASIHQLLVSTGGSNSRKAITRVSRMLTSSLEVSMDGSSGLPFDQALWPLAAGNLAWLNSLEQLQASGFLIPERQRLIISQPNIYIRSLVLQENGGEVSIGQAIDLLHDTVSIVADPEVTSESVAKSRVLYGALQSAFETTTAELLASTSQYSAGKTYSASTITGDTPLALTESSAKSIFQKAPAALLSDIRSGATVLGSPGDEATPMWWKIDTASGETQSRGLTGLGPAWMPEWFKALTKKGIKSVNKGRSGVHHIPMEQVVDDQKRWAQKTRISRKSVADPRYGNYRGVDWKAWKKQRGATSKKGSGTEYPTVLEVGMTLSFTVGETVGMACGLLMLINITMVYYGLVNDRY